MIGRVRTIDDRITKPIKWLAYVGAASLLLMTIITVIDIIGTKFFGWGFPAAAEFVEETMVASVFLAMGYVELERGNIRVGIFDTHFGRGLLHGIKLFSYVLAMLVTGFFSWRTFVYFCNVFQKGLEKPMSVITFPMSPGAFMAFLGFAILTIVLMWLFIKAIVGSK